MATVLNLNNEVVKMRKDVQRVKVLTIRKLFRHAQKLKSKKGTEEQVLKNQRRAQRLSEEIQRIKMLIPDDVTKTALRREINFAKVFNKANTNVKIRAITRLASHPLLKQKISALKDAVKAFKESRTNNAEEMVTKQPSLPSTPAKRVNQAAENKPKQGKARKKMKTEETKVENNVMEKTEVETVGKETDFTADNLRNEEHCSPTTPQAQALPAIPEVQEGESVLQSDSGKDIVQIKPQEKTEQCTSSQKVSSTSESDSSDLEESDEEDKEYFDDSTEERFLKQMPRFEDSDSDSEDDFFIGKVRQTKKKKSGKHDDQNKKEKLPQANTQPSVSGMEEQKSSTGPKNVKLESVFYTSLAEIKPKPYFVPRESKSAPARNKKTVFHRANPSRPKPQPAKAPAEKQQRKVQEQTLHPSWEASKKRKEQSKTAVFQGKKIVFDD